jgi:N-methylhydantoinase A
MLLGIDTGGTFTDFVLYDGSGFRIHKVLSTPHAPEEAILQGIEDLGVDKSRLVIIHGSTVATNAVLEGKGVRTVFITNHGLRDMLTIGRQARRELYRLQPIPELPPVSRELCIETGGRLGADGQVVEPLSKVDLQALKSQLTALAPRAVAINLLFSFLDDRFEKDIEAIVPAGIFVSRSSAILPEYKEYERGMTTWLNASIGPIVETYLQRLAERLGTMRISVMQSSGGTMTTEHAGRMAVHMLLSGPAGGMAGARYMGEIAGRQRLLTLDMGGTSTDVAMIDGDLRLTNEGRIGHYPVGIPMVDLHTIGGSRSRPGMLWSRW